MYKHAPSPYPRPNEVYVQQRRWLSECESYAESPLAAGVDTPLGEEHDGWRDGTNCTVEDGGTPAAARAARESDKLGWFGTNAAEASSALGDEARLTLSFAGSETKSNVSGGSGGTGTTPAQAATPDARDGEEAAGATMAAWALETAEAKRRAAESERHAAEARAREAEEEMAALEARAEAAEAHLRRATDEATAWRQRHDAVSAEHVSALGKLEASAAETARLQQRYADAQVRPCIEMTSYPHRI